MCLVGDRGSTDPLLLMVRLVAVEMDVRMLVKFISEKKRSVISYFTWLCIKGIPMVHWYTPLTVVGFYRRNYEGQVYFVMINGEIPIRYGHLQLG